MRTDRINSKAHHSRNSAAAAIAAAGLAFMSAAHGQTADENIVVAELFTSQSCNSCVSANEIFRDLVRSENVIGLAWHVDYWNMLQTSKGRWQDPYSSKENTERQRAYNRNIRGRTSVYTPQMVFNGESETIGSSREKISAAVNKSTTRRPIPLATVKAQNAIEVSIGKSDDGGNAYLISFLQETTTEIPRGENAGETLAELNVVTGLKKLGVVRKAGQTISVEFPPENQGCVILIQEPGQGRILGAQYCP